MTDAEPATGPDPRDEERQLPKSAGERLRAAREAQGLSLADVAARTRVPIRHLEAIESGDYSAMPTPTYAIGFARAYARAVGEDEVAIARDVRGETAATAYERQQYRPYEIDDPARLPPRGLALGAAAVAVVIIIAAVAWFGSGWLRQQPVAPITVASAPVPRRPPVRPIPSVAAPGSGPIVLTALDRVWVRVHDTNGQTLYEGTMAPGDTFQLPPEAAHPMVSIGRPDKLKITLDGAAVPPLGTGARPVKDVPIDAAALRARLTAAPAETAPASAAPVSAAPARTSAAPEPAAPKPRPSPTPRARHTPAPQPAKAPLVLDLHPAPAPIPTPRSTTP